MEEGRPAEGSLREVELIPIDLNSISANDMCLFLVLLFLKARRFLPII